MEIVKTKIVFLLIVVILSSCNNTSKIDEDSKILNSEQKQNDPKPEFDSLMHSVSDSREVRDDYLDSLNSMTKIWSAGSIPNKDMILFCLPTTNHEALEYYNLDYSDNKEIRDAFSKTNSYIEDKCSTGDTTYLRRYFLLSEFVDGYFAEVYFTNVEVYIDKYLEYFCDIYLQLEGTKVARLHELYKEKCNQ